MKLPVNNWERFPYTAYKIPFRNKVVGERRPEKKRDDHCRFCGNVRRFISSFRR